jgi:hypothetical protein
MLIWHIAKLGDNSLAAWQDSSVTHAFENPLCERQQGNNMALKKSILFGIVTFAMSSVVAYAQTELTVYTAVEAEDLARYAETFNKDHPDIKINWVRDSTGVVTAKLLAEKNNPQADVVWGLAATSLLVLKTEGMLEPYAPAGLDALSANFRDSDNPPSWVGRSPKAGSSMDDKHSVVYALRASTRIGDTSKNQGQLQRNYGFPPRNRARSKICAFASNTRRGNPQNKVSLGQPTKPNT